MVEAVRDRRYHGPGVSNHAKTDAGRRDIGIDPKLAAELTAWKPQQAAELPRVNFHSLRHTAATILASSLTPPGTVHRLLGHASFITTMKLYGGLTAEALEKAAEALGDAFELKPAEDGTREASDKS